MCAWARGSNARHICAHFLSAAFYDRYRGVSRGARATRQRRRNLAATAQQPVCAHRHVEIITNDRHTIRARKRSRHAVCPAIFAGRVPAAARGACAVVRGDYVAGAVRPAERQRRALPLPGLLLQCVGRLPVLLSRRQRRPRDARPRRTGVPFRRGVRVYDPRRAGAVVVHGENARWRLPPRAGVGLAAISTLRLRACLPFPPRSTFRACCGWAWRLRR